MRSCSARARTLGAFLVIAAITGERTKARACASCGCGDPTLTAVGVEKPYKNRLRLAVEERVGTRSSGGGIMRSTLFMTRTQIGVGYSPHARITLGAFLPIIASRLNEPNDREAWVRGIGDLELVARVVVARDRGFNPRHLFWLIGGVKTPTAPRLKDDQGYPYPDDDQPGTGSWDPIVGATYAWFGSPVTIYSHLLYRHPTQGPRDYRNGQTLLSSTVAQLQPFSWLALQLGADLRYEWASELQNGAAAPNTGGFLFALAPAALVNPWRDLILRAAVEVPVYQAVNGVQSAGPQFVFSVAYDFL